MFARNGLDVTLTSVQATGTIAALMAGETQFASSGPAEVAAADLQGASVVMVAEGAPLATYSLFTDRKFKSVPELAGQSIGVTAIGVGGDLAAHLYLRKFDVEDKVKTVATGGSSATILAAMDRGVVAGGMLIPPVTIQAERAGYAELVNGVKLGVPLSQGSLVMTRGFLRERPDVANRLIKGYLDTWKYLNDPANKASVVKIFEQYTKTETADAEMAYNVMLPQWQSEPVPYLSDPGIQNVITFLADPKARDADPKQFYDNSFLKAIASQAGS
jgi:ABC-type nitrate/sulfonate/bicarbonate transport system substrate-binding protein